MVDQEVTEEEALEHWRADSKKRCAENVRVNAEFTKLKGDSSTDIGDDVGMNEPYEAPSSKLEPKTQELTRTLNKEQGFLSEDTKQFQEQVHVRRGYYRKRYSQEVKGGQGARIEASLETTAVARCVGQ